MIDETSCAEKGDKTPGVQRQYLGCVGKIDNGVVTVHVGLARGDFRALLDADLYRPRSWLADRDRTGRPRLLTPADRESLRELLDCSPQGMGYFAAQRTVPLLREHLIRRTGRPFSDDTLRRELQRLRYSWMRSRYTLDPDPAVGGKKEAHPAATPAIAGT